MLWPYSGFRPGILPGEVVFRSYLDGDLAEEYTVSEIDGVTVISHEFPDFDRLVLEFTKGAPFNRVVLDQVEFGESTDYELSYGTELTRTPKGTTACPGYGSFRLRGHFTAQARRKARS